jgi:hypothetical protein
VALTRNSAVDSEPCQVPFSCFVASVAIIIGAVRMLLYYQVSEILSMAVDLKIEIVLLLETFLLRL